jgi:serine/threonine protein phosphatase PrpC
VGQLPSMAVDRVKVKSGMEVASLSDVGRVRANNEDSYLYWEPELEDEFLRKGRLAVIADGMGGHEGGQEASRMAVETVRAVYDKSLRSDPQDALVEALTAAHERIQNHAEHHPDLQGMGTTCTALAVVGGRLYFAHVGDSRLYLVRGNVISRITRDHSYVGRLVESGILRSEDAELHPQRHILTAALGAGREVTADVAQAPMLLENGDTLVLCTDGLWSVVGDQELAAVVRQGSPENSCATMVEMALQRGGPDNITVQVLRVVSAE